MLEALILFESLANSMWFETTAFVVLLNKVHLFREKLASGMSPIRKYFPEYRGKSTDIKTAEEFFANKFRNVFPDRGRQFNVHYINATDTDSTKKTLESIQEMIVQHNLYDIVPCQYSRPAGRARYGLCSLKVCWCC
jgi:guanine nucleotide-binding protein subunit alpha, other